MPVCNFHWDQLNSYKITVILSHDLLEVLPTLFSFKRFLKRRLLHVEDIISGCILTEVTPEELESSTEGPLYSKI